MIPFKIVRPSPRGRAVARGGASSNNTGSRMGHLSSVIVQITGNTPDFRFCNGCASLGAPLPAGAQERSNTVSICRQHGF